MTKFSPVFLEEIRNRLPCSTVVGRRVKLKKQGREWAGLSPFNQEKTPSFFVNDAKARWFDFSAGKDGDVFSFVMETEGLDFPTAVERLARDAGVPMPKADPEFVAREARKLSLIEVQENAADYFTESLGTEEGTRAREYLAARGIDASASRAFALGYAPAGYSGQIRARFGASVDQEIAAGLVRDDEGRPVERFAGRVIFPIHDLKGRVVAFSGRALQPDAKPKYLNSPETETFDKGSTLYNAHRARQPAWDGAEVVCVEGYGAVIASTAAGYPATVATMGTALTERHLPALWRLADEPIICFDGDAAGARAAARAIELAMPMLTPGRSLRFAIMPPGLDPDDVVRKRGAATYAGLLKAALPMADMLWRVKTAGRSLLTPEQRGSLEHDLGEAIDKLPTPALRNLYRSDMRRRVRSLGSLTPIRRSNSVTSHSASPGSMRLAAGYTKSAGLNLNEAMLVAAMVRSPSAALDHIEGLASAALSPVAREAVSKITDILAGLPDGGEVMAALQGAGLAGSIEDALSICHTAGIKSLDPDAGEGAARAILKGVH